MKKHDAPRGQISCLTTASAEDPEATALLLEPSNCPPAKSFKDALGADGSSFTQFAVDDVRTKYEHLRGLGVHFTEEPTTMGAVCATALEAPCGKLIQIFGQPESLGAGTLLQDGMRQPACHHRGRGEGLTLQHTRMPIEIDSQEASSTKIWTF